MPLPHIFNPFRRETIQSIRGSEASWERGRIKLMEGRGRQEKRHRASSPYPDKPGALSLLHLLLEPYHTAPSAPPPSTWDTWDTCSEAHLADS